jgi:hypothetical protein
MTDDREHAAELDELLPRSALEEWTVPEMPEDMKDRVMTQMHEPWTVGMDPPAVTLPPRRPVTTTIATFTAVAALAASVAAIVIGLHGADPPRIEVPIVSATPPPVAVAEPIREPRGHLTIATDPPDAICEVDGVALPGPSPFVATDLGVGPHEIRIHREGNDEWQRVVNVPDGQLHLPVTLQPGPPLDAIATSDAQPGSIPARSAPRREATNVLVKGALSKVAIRRVVRAHLDEVRHCYNQRLVRNPTLAGRVVVQFTIGPRGDVPVAVVRESNLSDGSVGNCIAKAVKTWEFPAPEGGGNVVVSYPFALEPGFSQ